LPLFWIYASTFNIDNASTLSDIFTIGANGLAVLLYYYVARRIIDDAGQIIDKSANVVVDIQKSTDIRTRRFQMLMLSLLAVMAAALLGSLVSRFSNHPSDTTFPLFYYVVPFFFGPLSEEYLFRKALHIYSQATNTGHYLLFSAIIFSLIQGYDITIASLIGFVVTFSVAYFFLAIPYAITRSLPLVVIIHISWNAMLTLSPYLVARIPENHIFTFICLVSTMFTVLVASRLIFQSPPALISSEV
jgi:membrane protease YdiL (CAAX protease family)